MPCAPGFVAKMAVAMDIDIDGIDVSTSWLEGCCDSQAILNKNSWYGPAGQPHFCWCRHVPVRGFRNRTRPPRNLHYLNLLRLVIRLFPFYEVLTIEERIMDPSRTLTTGDSSLNFDASPEIIPLKHDPTRALCFSDDSMNFRGTTAHVPDKKVEGLRTKAGPVRSQPTDL